ncbi:MAG: aminotransferase class V-fold PLP-dependent enzyme, partial [Candidatus Methylomirabilia bacterium]
NLAAIVGMGVAAELARQEGPEEARRLSVLRDRLLQGLTALPDCRVTGSPVRRLPHHASLSLRGVKSDSVLMDLDLQGVIASSGSACASVTHEPSHVLRAIGLDSEESEGALCFTLGRWTTTPEVETVLSIVPRTVSRLRALAPPKLVR